MEKMKKRVIAFAIVALILLTVLAPTAKASTSVYKDYKPSKSLVRNWVLGFFGLRLETKSEVSNLVVRAYSDKKIRVWGDIETYGAALQTSVFVQVITAKHATVNVNSFTWNGLTKWHITYSDVIIGRDPRMPGVQFVTLGGGSGHFDVTISSITPDDEVFGVVVTVGNLGSALAMVFDIFMLMTVPADTLAIIFSIKDAVRLGMNIASLLVTPFTFKATDEWPKASGAPAVATPKPDRTEIVRPFAVYYDEDYPTDWISRDEAEAIRNYLSDMGFTVLDADDLETFMEDEGKLGVVVMAQDVVPDTVASTPFPGYPYPPSNSLIRQYLDRGGRVVWIGNTPFYYQGHRYYPKTRWGTRGISTILDMNVKSSWSVGTVSITADGAEAGLTQTWYSEAARESSVTKVYASIGDCNAAWMKSFDNGGEFRRIWDSDQDDFSSEAYLQDLVTVATTGSLSWEVEMTAYNADPQYARCGDININGYQKRVISWINPVAEATATTNVPGYWFNHELNAINAWVTTYDEYDNQNSWITVKLTSPEGFKIQYYKMKPANLDRKAYFEIEMTGLWRVTTYRYNTSPTALAYNLPDTHTYNTGSRTTGAFMFTVDLKSYTSSTLDFFHCYWTESRSDDAYDVLRVQISTDLGQTWTTLKQWDSRDPNVETWTQVTLDISPYCGNLVQIRFYFDSVDYKYNYYEGWYIDDITITATSSLVGNWRFDEGSRYTAVDSSPYGNHGSIYGATWTTGKGGDALSFDGVNDYVNVPDSASLDITQKITIEAWVNLQADHADPTATMIRKQGNFLLELGDAGNNRPSFNLWFTDGTEMRVDGPPIPKFEWHYWAATYDGYKMKLYIDGNLVASCDVSKSIATSAESLRIGRWTTEWFKGIIDEVRIYNRALSAEEIYQIAREVVNGGFETGYASGWVTGGYGDHVVTSEDFQSGSYSMLLGFKNSPNVKNARDWCYQIIAIPAGVTSAYISFYYHLFTEDYEPYDWFEVYVRDSSGNNLEQVFYKAGTTGGLEEFGWEQVTYDLSAYAGQTIQLYFAVANWYDTGYKTWCYIDDVVSVTFGFGYEGDYLGGVHIENYIVGSWFTCPENGKALGMSIRVHRNSGADPSPVRCAIYRKSDGSFVAETEEIYVDYPGYYWDPQWVTLDFETPPCLSAGEDYWLVAWAGGNIYFYLTVQTSETPKLGIQSLTYGGNFPTAYNPYVYYYIANIYCTVMPT